MRSNSSPIPCSGQGLQKKKKKERTKTRVGSYQQKYEIHSSTSSPALYLNKPEVHTPDFNIINPHVIQKKHN